MIKAMRIANAVLIPLMAFWSMRFHSFDLSDHERMWSASIGIVLTCVPFYLAWRGLGSKSTLTLIRSARLANVLAGLLYVVFVGFISLLVSSATTSKVAVFFVSFFMLMMGAPYALNVSALANRKIELEEQKAR